MAQAKKGDTVTVRYRAKVDDGTVVDDNLTEGAPLQFRIGDEEVVEGFEEAVVGMSPGQSKTVKVLAAKAYGLYFDDMVITIPRCEMGDIEPEEGQNVTVTPDEGDPFDATVSDVTEDEVTLDANHPLAGEDLTFEIELLEIV